MENRKRQFESRETSAYTRKSYVQQLRTVRQNLRLGKHEGDIFIFIMGQPPKQSGLRWVRDQRLGFVQAQ
jgi:hypothetical protein